MSYEPLDRKYRPKTFEEIKGQDRCVRYLSNIVLRRARPRNVLLHGSVGSGKTSLARIYARAINCLTPSPHGSPCGSCSHCLMPDGEHWQEYDVSGDQVTSERLSAWLQTWNRRSKGLEYRTLFLDEAHRLSEPASDALLKTVEEPAEGVVFVFATTEIEKMRRALLSRLAQLEVMPLSPAESLEFLTRFAESEGMKYDSEALWLLGGLKDNYPRDLLIGLEQVHMGSDLPITIARVKQEFDIDHTSALVDYLCALGDPTPSKQISLLLEWREPVESKVRWIQSVLLSLYYNHILSSQIVVDPLILSIDRPSIAQILMALRTRFGAKADRDLQNVLRAMIEFWATPIPITTDAALILRLAAFHEMVNASEISSAPTTRPTLSSSVRDRASSDLEFDRLSAIHPEVDREQFQLGSERFITASDVREIIRSASFLTQRYGRLFNLRIELRPSDLGRHDEKGAYALIADFCDELTSRNQNTYFITLVERDARGLQAIILAHVDQGIANSGRDQESISDTILTEWAQTWRLADSTTASPISIQPIGEHGRHLSHHWRNVLDLCAGLDPDEALDGMSDPLSKVLKLRTRLHDPSPVCGPIYFVSPNLSRTEMKAAAEDKMGFISAFDDHQWDRLKDGWELKEYNDRQKELARRRDDMKRLQRVHGAGTPKYVEALADLKKAWPIDPRDRPRSWPVWWTPGQV